MTKHPRNKAERRLIEAKKKRKPSMRSVELSVDNHHAAIESFLHSMRLIDENEYLYGFEFRPDGHIVHLRKHEQEGSVN